MAGKRRSSTRYAWTSSRRRGREKKSTSRLHHACAWRDAERRSGRRAPLVALLARDRTAARVAQSDLDGHVAGPARHVAPDAARLDRLDHRKAAPEIERVFAPARATSNAEGTRRPRPGRAVGGSETGRRAVHRGWIHHPRQYGHSRTDTVRDWWQTTRNAPDVGAPLAPSFADAGAPVLVRR